MDYFLEILCFIGLISFVVGIVWLIFNLIKNRNFRIPVLVMLFGLVFFLGAPAIYAYRTNAKEAAAEAQSRKESSELDSLLSDDTDSSYEDDDSSSSSSEDSTYASSEDTSNTTTSDDTSSLDDSTDFNSIKDYPKSERLNVAVEIIKNNFSSIADVTYDERTKSIQITPKDFSVVEEAILASSTGDTDKWKEMTNSIDRLSTNLYDSFDLSNIIMIMNSSSTGDRALYAVKNGKTLYDITTDGSED